MRLKEIEKIITQDTFFTDIGVNIIYYILLDSEITNCGKILAFESHPDNL